MTALALAPEELYSVREDWRARLHELLGMPWPCDAESGFEPVWSGLTARLRGPGEAARKDAQWLGSSGRSTRLLPSPLGPGA